MFSICFEVILDQIRSLVVQKLAIRWRYFFPKLTHLVSLFQCQVKLKIHDIFYFEIEMKNWK